MSIAFPSDDIIISDANVLINFLDSGHFELLIKLFQGKLHITDTVRAEIKQHNSELDKAIEEGKVKVHKVPIEQVAHLAKSFENFQAGEASCFVLAKEKGWRIGTDDGAAKVFIRKELGMHYIFTTFDVLLKAVRLGIIKKTEVESVVDEMEKKANFFYGEEDYKKFSSELKKS